MPDLETRDPRIPKALPVIFQQGASWVKAYARDISRGGLFVVTESPLIQGDRFTLKLQLPGQEEMLNLVCQVAWASKKEAREDAGMGVKFLETMPEHEALLKPFVTALEHMNIKPFEMSEKDNKILQDSMSDMKARPPLRSA